MRVILVSLVVGDACGGDDCDPGNMGTACILFDEIQAILCSRQDECTRYKWVNRSSAEYMAILETYRGAISN